MTLDEALQEERRDPGLKRGDHSPSGRIHTSKSYNKKTATNLDADFSKEQNEYSHKLSEQMYGDDFLSLPTQLHPYIEMDLHRESSGSSA
eukprot:13587111-Ditylum_brightwellii.AAC.1